MELKLKATPTIFKPTLLSTGYAAGQVLFDAEEITALNRHGEIYSTLVQLGVFWNIASAPEITLYFFRDNPAGFGSAGSTPAPTFDERASLTGVWEISQDDGQGYETLAGSNSADNSYALFSGDLAHFASDDSTGYMTAICKDTVSTDLEGTLAITLLARK